MNDQASLNAICPYYTMFPLDFPLRVLRNNATEGDVVLDPFCGRGTTTYAARLLGHPAAGIDSSPIAVAIAHAKSVCTTREQVLRSARGILASEMDSVEIPKGRFWRLAYHRETLKQVCKIRTSLLRGKDSPSRAMLRAIMLGALHGPVTKTTASYFSNQSPRTFAPKPKYATKFWTERGLKPQHVDVIQVIMNRAERYLKSSLAATPSTIIHGDSRDVTAYEGIKKVSWVITSPPYYGMRTYLPDQWIRHWFLGGPDEVEYAQRDTDLDHGSPTEFAEQLRAVWVNAATKAKPNAKLVSRFGGIQDRRKDPLEIFKKSLEDTPWRLTTIRSAGTASQGKRQAKQFGSRIKSKPRAEFDIYAQRR